MCMQLSVVRQTYNAKEAANLAYSRKGQLLTFIRNQLKLKHIQDAYVREYAEDVLNNGMEILLTSRYDCANADEAISEAVSRAVQNVVRELSNRGKNETADTFTYSDNKDGDREVSRMDLAGGSMSAEQVVIELDDICDLDEAIERAESIRYVYGFDVLLNLLLRAGTAKGMWQESVANGLLVAFESATPSKKYYGDVCITRVLSAAAVAEPHELVQVMRRNLSRCDLMLNALGYSEA